MKHLPKTLSLLALVAATGCGTPTKYVKENVDLGAITAVAVLPFENVTNDKLCSERVYRIFVTEMLNLDAFQVVEPGQVLRSLRADGMEPATLTPEDIKVLGKSLGVQALIVGSVLEYDDGRSGSTAGARVRLQFRMIDTQTATTLWSVSRFEGGATILGRLFGASGTPASTLAEGIIRRELAAFVR